MSPKLLLSLSLASSTAFATVPDKFGVGAKQVATGGGGVAHVDSAAAASINPAGLHRIRRPTLAASFAWGMQRLQTQPSVWWDTNRDGVLDERDSPLQLPDDGADDLFGFQVSVGRHLGKRFGLGLSIYLPATRLFRLETFEPAIPHYILYANRGQRYVATAGVGGEVVPGVAIGVGVDFVPRVAFTVGMTADIVVEGDAEAEDLGELVADARIDIHEVALDVVPGLAPTVGLQLDFGRWSPKLEGLRLGATWRGRVGIPITADLDIQANLSAEDIGTLDPFALAAIIDADLFLFDHYLPMKVDAGLSYQLAPFLLGTADFRWTDWRGLLLSVARIADADLTTPLFDLDDAIRDGNAHDLVVRSTLGVRVGAEMKLPRFEFSKKLRYLQLVTRAGFGWEQGPLLGQDADSNFLDGDRWWFSGGLGGEIWDPIGITNGPVRLDGFFQYHRLVTNELQRTTTTPRAGYPVDADRFVAGGWILLVGAEMSFEY